MVVLPVQDERRHPDAGQHPGEVGAHEELVDRCGRAWPCAETLGARVPAAEGRLVRAGRREMVDQRSSPRNLTVELDIALRKLGRNPERRFGTAKKTGEGVDEDEGGRPVWIGRGEQHQRKRRLRHCDERCLLAVGRVENRADVVHPGLQRGQTRGVDRVRGARAAEIAHDQASEPGQAPQATCGDRVIPEEIDRGGRPWHVEDVALAPVRHLIGDVITTAHHIASLGCRRHDPPPTVDPLGNPAVFGSTTHREGTASSIG